MRFYLRHSKQWEEAASVILPWKRAFRKNWVQNTVFKSLLTNFDYSLEIALWETEAVRLAATAQAEWSRGDKPSQL